MSNTQHLASRYFVHLWYLPVFMHVSIGILYFRIQQMALGAPKRRWVVTVQGLLPLPCTVQCTFLAHVYSSFFILLQLFYDICLTKLILLKVLGHVGTFKGAGSSLIF